MTMKTKTHTRTHIFMYTKAESNRRARTYDKRNVKLVHLVVAAAAAAEKSIFSFTPLLRVFRWEEEKI